MGHTLQLFAGPLGVLRPFAGLSTSARAYALTPDADLAVVPFDEAVQDDLHARFGTGDWPEHQHIRLSTTDQAFAADCSLHGPIAYFETDYFGGNGMQSAAVWQHGQLVMGPATMQAGLVTAARAASLRPINQALRMLGVGIVRGAIDEFESFGLGSYRSNEAIHEKARVVPF